MKTDYCLVRKYRPKSKRELDRFCGNNSSSKNYRKFLKEIQASMREEIKRIEERIKEIRDFIGDDDEPDDEDIPFFGIFRPDIDENGMANAFYELHEHFFGTDREEMIDGPYRNELAFAAYLFMLVDYYHLGRDNFYDNAVKPFYEFIKCKVMPGMQGTRRTFSTRVKVDMEYLRLSCKAKAELTPVQKKLAEPLERNFQRICGNFQRTKYGKQLNEYF